MCIKLLVNVMVSIILLNWNGSQDTISCLESLRGLHATDFRIIVCDNGSTDDSWLRLENYVSDQISLNIKLLQTGSNLGYAAGNNIGIRYALEDPETQFLWLLNNDTVVTPESLHVLMEYMAQHSDVGVCGSTLCYLDAPEVIQAVGGRYNTWLGRSTHLLGHEPFNLDVCRSVKTSCFDYVVGASMFIRREVLEKIGALSEDYFLYYEEIDWATRMKREASEFRIGYAPESVVYHREGASTGTNDQSKKSYHYFSDYFFITSRLRFSRKYYPFCSLTVQLSMLLVAFNRLRFCQWRSAAVALWCFCGIIPVFMDPRRVTSG